MYQFEYPAIPDVECPDVKIGWPWVLEAWKQHRRVQATVDLGGRPGEGDWHPCRDENGKKKKGKPPY